MPNNTITFAALRQLLSDLGFVEKVLPQSHVVFEHAPSDTIFVFRPYRPRDRVADYDLVGVRRHLDERGLLECGDFENRLHQPSA